MLQALKQVEENTEAPNEIAMATNLKLIPERLMKIKKNLSTLNPKVIAYYYTIF